MKPENTKRQPLLLPDGQPTHCDFEARADAPHFWESCEQWATVRLGTGEVVRFQQWKDEHLKHTITLRTNPRRDAYVCDAHEVLIRECL
jgi:hypothetical protein